MRAWLVLASVLTLLWATHLVATSRSGLTLPDELRALVGASADTVWSRVYAHFTAPLFHDNLFHIAYNSALLAVALPLAFRAFGGKSLILAYLASVVVGIAVDALLILPLAHAGSATAIGAAPTRLVGASVFAFALVGMALVAQAPRLGAWAAAPFVLIAVYEVALALFGVTRPFVWAYHLGGLLTGTAAGLFLRR